MGGGGAGTESVCGGAGSLEESSRRGVLALSLLQSKTGEQPAQVVWVSVLTWP